MKLIVFEGLDGSGKTSVINEICYYFDSSNITYYISCETDDTFGKMAKFGNFNITSDETLYLWWLSRIREQKKIINMDVDVVIKDRYYDSSYVYQLIENSTIYDYNFNKDIFLMPDLTIFLDALPETSLNRMGNLDLRKEDLYETDDYITLNTRRDKYKSLYNRQSSFRNIKTIVTDELSLDFVTGGAIHYIDNFLNPYNYSEFVEK